MTSTLQQLEHDYHRDADYLNELHDDVILDLPWSEFEREKIQVLLEQRAQAKYNFFVAFGFFFVGIMMFGGVIIMTVYSFVSYDTFLRVFAVYGVLFVVAFIAVFVLGFIFKNLDLEVQCEVVQGFGFRRRYQRPLGHLQHMPNLPV